MTNQELTTSSTWAKILTIPVNRPGECLFIVFVLACVLVVQAKQLTFDTSVESFLDDSNPQHKAYIDFKRTYGLSEFIIVFIESDNIFTEQFLQHFRSLHNELENAVPHIAKIESLLNTRHIVSVDNDIHIDSLIPEDLNSSNLGEIKQAALNTPYYLNRLINRNGNVTSIVIKLEPVIKDSTTGKIRHIVINDVEHSLKKIISIVAKHQSQFDSQIRVGGSPTATVELLHAVKRDTLVLMIIALVVISLVLWLFFRRLLSFVLPILVLCLTVAITMSVMLILQFPIQVTGAILPSFLVVICVGDSVHLLHAYYHLIDSGIEKKQAIIESVHKTFTPMFYTSLTTSIGLLSFTNSDIFPIRSFGLFSAFGVCIALILTLVCLPALLMLFPVSRLSEQIENESGFAQFNKVLLSFIEKHSRSLIGGSLIIVGGSSFFISQLSLSHNPIEWFDKSNPVRESIEIIDHKLTGTHPIELLIDTGIKNGIYDPVLLNSIDQWTDKLKLHELKGIKVNSTVSLINLIKEANQLLSDEKQYVLPQSRELIAQELLLLQVNAADEVSAYTDNQFRTLRITISTPWQDAVNYTQFLHELKASFQKNIKTSNTSTPKLTITGLAAIGNQTVTEMLFSMVNSYIIAGLLISIVLMILLRNFKLGALMMLPNLLPIVIVLSVMFFSNVPFDMFTLMIGSIALGLIVDDSVHFTHSFQSNYRCTGRVLESIQLTLTTVGRALFITTVVLCSGFLVYVFSSLQNMQTFGVLTSLCVLLALIADFLVAPAIILLLYKDTNN